MDKCQNIIDVQHHPIEDVGTYAMHCRRELKKNSILILNNFITKNALLELQHEADTLHDKAFYCSQNHNVLLTEKNVRLKEAHPCNIEVTSDKGCVPHDLIPPNSHLRTIYTSEKFQRFIQSVFAVEKIWPYSDPLSSINLNYYEEKQQLGWHFDNASLAITLMIRPSESGGIFQFVMGARDIEKNTINVPLLDSVLHNKTSINELNMEAGSLVLFYGCNTLHRVTPVTSQKPRVLATLNYNLEKNIKLSENARVTFFGRLN
jgi:hypothetical protein